MIDYGFNESLLSVEGAGRPPAVHVANQADAVPADAPPSACCPRAAVVNATAVRALGYRDARSLTGAVVTLSCGKDWRQVRVLGVVPDINYNLTRGPAPPTLYPEDRRTFVTHNVKIRAGQVPATVAAIDRAWARSGQPFAIRRSFAGDSLLRGYADVITQGELLGALAGVTAVIACLGVFALAAFTAERRTKQIGVRKVMGASGPQIARLLLWSLVEPVLWANLIALARWSARCCNMGYRDSPPASACHRPISPPPAAPRPPSPWSPWPSRPCASARSEPARALRYE